MTAEIQILYVLGTLAVTATVARLSFDGKVRLFDWLALGSLALLLAQITSMIATRTF
ncbi:MAG: hypothetical protein ACREQN_08350 [Candidatus Binataceae bacterium]